MFGMSFSEIIIIAVVAVIALGPEKLPKAMYELAKILKVVKRTINDAKSSIDQEIKIAELKEDAKKYKDTITKTGQGIRKKLTFEELDDIKNTLNNTSKDIQESINKKSETKKEISSNDTTNEEPVKENIEHKNLETDDKGEKNV